MKESLAVFLESTNIGGESFETRIQLFLSF
jgi:hypothetical protein